MYKTVEGIYGTPPTIEEKEKLLSKATLTPTHTYTLSHSLSAWSVGRESIVFKFLHVQQRQSFPHGGEHPKNNVPAGAFPSSKEFQQLLTGLLEASPPSSATSFFL